MLVNKRKFPWRNWEVFQGNQEWMQSLQKGCKEREERLTGSRKTENVAPMETMLLKKKLTIIGQAVIEITFKK